MATSSELTTSVSVSATGASNTSNGSVISAATFNQMIDVLESLANHNHIFYDDYTTVCQCQCQCACSRGTV